MRFTPHHHHAEAGQGRPVVMPHGMGGPILSKVHDELAKKYRVIAFEMPGIGQSPANATSPSAQDLARTMAQAAAQLGPDTYALIGTSFGGRVALWQALQAPQLSLRAGLGRRPCGSCRAAGGTHQHQH